MKKKFELPLINTHVHAAMVAFRGIAEDTPLDKWLNDFIFPLEKEKVDPNFVYEQTKIAIQEMQNNGIRAFCDMYFFEEEVAKAAEEMKMRAIIGTAIMDFPVPGADNPRQSLAKTEELLNNYRDHPYVSVAVAPHTCYTVPAELLVAAKTLARKYNAVFQTHAPEMKVDFDSFIQKNGCTPIKKMEKLGLLDEKTLLAHCVWVSDEDIDILAKNNVSVAHCPLSNLKLGSGIAPVAKMLAAGVNVAIGTDGAASSNRLDVWEAGKFAALLQKGITNDPTAITAKDAVKMMTVNGMKALGIEELGGKTVSEMENEIAKTDDYNFLYSLNVDELKFNQ
jgi:5-methylthioadenosine/S-adenosylhomocysteine deaminase